MLLLVLGCGGEARAPAAELEPVEYADFADVVMTGAAGESAGAPLLAGDVTGDGVDDLIAGAEEGDALHAAYVVDHPADGPLRLVAAARVEGMADDAEMGAPGGPLVAGTDLDGDGVGDLVVGAPGTAGNAGAVRVLSLVAGEPREVAVVHGAEDVTLAWAAAGDLGGDAIPDLLVTGTIAYEAWVIDGPLSGDVALDVAAARIASIAGHVDDLLAADLTGDGLGDAVFWTGGGARVLFGPVRGELDAADADVPLPGDVPRGAFVAGDLDGDGVDDLLYPSGFGEIGLVRSPLTAGAEPAARFAHGQVGTPLEATPPGDADGDGLADVLFAAGTWDGPSGSDDGAVFLALAPFSGTIDLAAVRRVEGAEPRAAVGTGAALADLDGDGVTDVAAGAPGAGGDGTGAVYLFLGPM